jgi:hypothetical protein
MWMDRARRWPIVFLFLMAGASRAGFAGGPLRVDDAGQPYRWDMSQPIRYSVAPGPLGSRSHDWAVAAVESAVRTWESVPSAQVRFEASGDLPRRITGSNVMAFLHGLTGDSPCPVLFDTDGTITQTLLGQGAIEAGFAGPLIDLPRDDRILLGYVVLSGPGLAAFGDTRTEKVVVHEFGHMLGLDHSQINADLLYDGDPTNDYLAPVMSYFRGPNGDGSLHRDDQAWISWLYPSSSFADSTGSIHGRVLLPDGVTGLRGINVIARRVDDPRATSVSSVSGYLFGGTGGGARDPARLGEFMIPGLPPGRYTLEIQPLEDMPVVRVPAAYLPGGPKFWHEPSMAQDAPGASTPILVNAGQEVNGIDIVVNGEDLGPPAQVKAQEPNALPNAQKVTMPVMISGAIPDAPGAGPDATAGPPLDPSSVADQLQDVYDILVREPTTVTAILSAAQRGADLDLYVLRKSGQKYVIEGSSTLVGTPPEVVQIRLAAGHHYVGIHRAAARGTAYTLSLLATPAPPPEQPSAPVWLNYLLIGDVTTNSAALRWQTTDAVPSVVYYNQPLQETGAPQPQQDHALTLTGLATGQRSEVEVFIPLPGNPAQPGYTFAPVTAAVSPAPGGTPRIVASHTTSLLGANDFAQVSVHLSNPGDGDAHSVRITQVTLPTGWYVVSDVLTGEPLPAVLDLGGIGAGGAGDFVAWIERLRGSAASDVTVHGTYLDDTGRSMTF